MKLRTHFLLTVAITLVPLLIFSIVAIVVFGRQASAALEREFLETGRALLGAVELQQAVTAATLTALATSTHLDQGDLARFAVEASKVLRSQSDWLDIRLSSPSGQVLLTLPPPAPAPAPSLREGVLETVETRRPSAHGVSVGKDGALRTFSVQVPVLRGDAVRYVLGSTVKASVIGGLLLAYPLPPGSAVLILDPQNFLVASIPAAHWWADGVAPRELVAALDAGTRGWIKAPPDMHFDGFVAFNRSPSSRWAVALGAPSALVMEPLQRSFLIIAAVATCALLGYIAASAFAGRVARPLLSLVTSLNAFSRGATMPARGGGTVSEVEHAVQAVEEAARAIESRDAALRESESRFRQLAENIDAVFWVTDFPDRTVAYVSPAYERLWGMSAERLYADPHQWLRMIHPDDRPRAEALFVDRVREGPFDTEYRILTPDGRPRWVRDRGFPVRDADGRVRRVAGIAEDITDRKRAEMTLSENRMVLGLALDTAQIGVWDHDFLTDEIRMDGTAKALFGFVPEATLTFQRWASVLHPDDRPALEATRARALRTQSEFAAEYRVVRTDGTIRWVSMGGRGWFHQPGGKPLRMIGVVLDITERRRAEEERVALLERERAARAEAEAANHVKDEFLAMLGHELRNPLGAISNAVRVLEELGVSNEGGRRLREIITRQTRHLTRLIEDLLDVSRLTSGKIVLERRRTDLLEVSERCLASLAAAGRTAGHAVSLAGEPTSVDGDPTRLEQIMANLVDNAVKYTPPGGAIRVTVGPEGGEAVLRVADTGVGIQPELLTRVFELFVQDRRSLHRAGGGLGLGLTLVKRLVDLHGGTVWVQSDGPGGGARFEVRLPLAPGPADLPSGAPAAAEPVVPARVLVVEDHADARESLRLLLSLDGHEVEEAEDGHHAVEKILAWRPDVALVDIGLPGLDGYALARAVRAAPGGGELFLVALTGYGQPEDRKRAIEAGFDAHLVKPVEPDRLKELLGSVRSS